jgi:hypothetical protein
VAAFLDAGIERGEAAIAVVDERKWALLCDALGPAAAHIAHIDRDSYYTRLEAALAGYDEA